MVSAKSHSRCGIVFLIYVMFSSFVTAIWSIHNFKKYKINTLIDEIRTCSKFWSYMYTITIFSLILSVIVLLYLLRSCLCNIISGRSAKTISCMGVLVAVAYIALNSWGTYVYFNMSKDCKDSLKDEAMDIVKSCYAFISCFLISVVGLLGLAIMRTRVKDRYDDI